MVTTALPVSGFTYQEVKVDHTVWTTSLLRNIGAMSTASIEVNTLPGDHPLLRQLQAKQADKIREAMKYRANYGDPVQNLIGLLSKKPADYKRWQEVIDEPYG